MTLDADENITGHVYAYTIYTLHVYVYIHTCVYRFSLFSLDHITTTLVWGGGQKGENGSDVGRLILFIFNFPEAVV